ncbi:hypothetical protein COB11_03190 [Candidatus Aerophobetes bacterium]|uniref:Exostosin GT47 domain-containing protein n=1 Tax=Aerophobetes bacterium TaxID=2030807 RepID=A0A2A4YJV2_UNCAE|nr:MAG: hypothetical protein COB11_03190 [Candidatus Aerophobetes bacterium]
MKLLLSVNSYVSRQNMLFISLLFCFVSLFSIAESKDRRPTLPFITGDAFRSIADHIFDVEIQDINPDNVKERDVIFVSSNRLREFFGIVHPKIHSRYILITHNSDTGVPGEFSSFLNDEKILVWFGQNVTNYVHEKLIPIPIGLTNRYNSLGDPVHIESAMKRIARKKKYLLYLNAPLHTNRNVREKAYKYFEDKNFCVKVRRRVPVDRFFDHISRSKFVVSPRGNGLDCHRTWEALYLGAIPIVIKSSMDSAFEDLPVLTISSWEEVTEAYLLEQYSNMKKKKYMFDKLYAKYWLDLIKSYK